MRFELTAGAWMGSWIRGVLAASELSYSRSRNSTKVLVLESKDANVWKLLSPVLEAKMDKYVLAESGIGCRHWLLKVVELWKSAGLVSGGGGLQDAMEKVWDKYGNEVHRTTAIRPGPWE